MDPGANMYLSRTTAAPRGIIDFTSPPHPTHTQIITIIDGYTRDEVFLDQERDVVVYFGLDIHILPI
jgi:hypothetical protein